MSSSNRNAEFAGAAVKLVIFTVISVFVTGLLAVIMGNVGFGDGRTYQAVFSSATSLEKGDDVRVAGVSVGEVKEVEHHDRTQAIVTFRVQADVPVTTSTRAEIRFLNLVGDRYMALEAGADPKAERLDEDDVIPIANTRPALDLTVLFNGFKPLFEALQPDQVNELSMNLVQVLQGEGGTVRGLLQHTASLTEALADRDQLIGEVITNLGTTLDTVDGRRRQLGQLITELEGWMTDLARDRSTIGGSLDSIDDLAVVLADLLREGRPVLKRDIAELRRLAKLINVPKNRDQIIEIFDRLPESMTDQTRTGTYGSWYSYYVCGFAGKITLPRELQRIPSLQPILDALTDIDFRSDAERCNNNGGAGG